MGFSTTLTSAPTYIAADPKSPKEILNVSGGTIYYKVTDDVDAEDTAVTKGNTAQITAGSYFISASKSEIVVRELTVTTAEDITAVDDLTVGDDLAVTGDATVTGKTTAKGELEIDGELNHDGTKVGFMGSAPVAASTVKKEGLTANELATELAKMGLVKIEA